LVSFSLPLEATPPPRATINNNTIIVRNRRRNREAREHKQGEEEIQKTQRKEEEPSVSNRNETAIATSSTAKRNCPIYFPRHPSLLPSSSSAPRLHCSTK
jgi:hypothetical protein